MAEQFTYDVAAHNITSFWSRLEAADEAALARVRYRFMRLDALNTLFAFRHLEQPPQVGDVFGLRLVEVESDGGVTLELVRLPL